MSHGCVEKFHPSRQSSYPGSRTLELRPKGQEGYPEVPVRESPHDLTLGAEEVGTWKSCINVDHIAKERWRPSLVDADWHAFCQRHRRGRLERVK